MTEDQVQRIALRHIEDSELGQCSIVSIRRMRSTKASSKKPLDYEWVVQIRFSEENDSDDISVNPIYGMLVVDDVTGSAEFFDTL